STRRMVFLPSILKGLRKWPGRAPAGAGSSALSLVFLSLLKAKCETDRRATGRRTPSMPELPVEVGLRMPAEWEPHAATWIAWPRDYGPWFVLNAPGELRIVDWQFNAWAKYPNWQHDDAIAGQVSAALGVPAYQPRVGDRRIVMEGGSIDVNGRGLLLTTEEC